MKKAVALLVLILAASACCFSDDIACSSTVALAKQHRTLMKHRAPASSDPGVRTIAQVLKWVAPEGLIDAKHRRADTALSDREDMAFTVEGDLWRVKLEANDCDFHLELAAPGKPKAAARIVVEVPQGEQFLQAREDVIELLTANGYDVGVDKSINLEEPVRIKLTGLAFYDTAHFSKKNPKKGHGHGTQYVGTLWELHPVWKVETVEQ